MLRFFPEYKRARTAILFAFLVPLFGCDGGIRIHGCVYTQTKPVTDAKSTAYESDPAVTRKDLVPLGDAHVLLFRSPLAETGQTEAWKSGVNTDTKGDFETGGVCAPGRKEFSVQVGKDKYQALTYKFSTSTGQKTLYFVLSPSPSDTVR